MAFYFSKLPFHSSKLWNQRVCCRYFCFSHIKSNGSLTTACPWTLSPQSNIILSFQMNSLAIPSSPLISVGLLSWILGMECWECLVMTQHTQTHMNTHTYTPLLGSLCGSHDSNGHTGKGITDHNNEFLQISNTHKGPIYDTRDRGRPTIKPLSSQAHHCDSFEITHKHYGNYFNSCEWGKDGRAQN